MTQVTVVPASAVVGPSHAGGSGATTTTGGTLQTGAAASHNYGTWAQIVAGGALAGALVL